MKPSNSNVFLVLTAAVVIGGEIATKGALVEVSNSEARDLLHRKKARIATAEDGVEGNEVVEGGDEPEGQEAAAAKKPTKAKKAAAE